MTNGSTIRTNRGQQALARRERHLVGGVAEEALREELAADDDVPAHREDADAGPAAPGDDVEAAPARPLAETRTSCDRRASSASGTSVPRTIWTTTCDTHSRVCTMKSSARNDSSAS